MKSAREPDGSPQSAPADPATQSARLVRTASAQARVADTIHESLGYLPALLRAELLLSGVTFTDADQRASALSRQMTETVQALRDSETQLRSLAHAFDEIDTALDKGEFAGG